MSVHRAQVLPRNSDISSAAYQIRNCRQTLLPRPNQNPNNGIFTIDLPNTGAVKYSVEIINLTGQIVYSGKLLQGNEHQINLKGKLKGIYLLKVEQGAETFQKKIIVR